MTHEFSCEYCHVLIATHLPTPDFVSSDVVRSRTGQPLLSDTICQRCLSFFGHLCHADIGQDHSQALRACVRVLPKSGDEELEDRGKPGWEWLRMICARSTSAWRWQNGALWIDRHGVYSWMRLRPRDTLQRERERDGRLSWPEHHECK